MGNNTGTRRFEYKDEKSSKFWEITVTGDSFVVRYGKIGTDGQTQPKEFADEAAANKQAQKLIAEKTGKGYQEVNREKAPTDVSTTAGMNDSPSLLDSSLSFEQKLELAEDQDTSPEVLEALAFDEEQGNPGDYDETYALRRQVAMNANSPIQLLSKLLEDEEQEVRFEVARNSSLPQDLLYKLSEDEGLASAVAQNTNCPSSLLEKLSKMKDDEVRGKVAANPNCPVPLLKRWAKVKDEFFRANVASNPSSPIELLVLFASDDEVGVRESLASNPACPKDLLVRLSEDEDANVRRFVAGSDQCPEEILAKLESDIDIDVVRQVAANCHTPITILEGLAVHDEGKIRLAVALNSACPSSLQKIALTIPPCCFPENVQPADVMEPISELKRLVEEARSQYPTHSFFGHHGLKDIDFCAPAWSLKFFEIPTQNADRTRSMLEGPFFTSDKYPWPSGAEAEYASPVVQLDLREVTRLSERDYGDGLLQVFLVDDSSDFLARVIPRSDVNVKHMTPFPQGSDEQFSGFLTEKFWLGYGGVVSQIVGYEEPVLSAHVYADDGAPEEDDPDIIKDIFERMESLTMNDSGIHMFGTFYPIQYPHSEVGGEVLMTLDSESCYSWGDSGNAQIFVTREKDGSPRFSVIWSCY